MHLSLRGDGAPAEGVGVADPLEAADAVGLLRLVHNCCLHTADSPHQRLLTPSLSAFSAGTAALPPAWQRHVSHFTDYTVLVLLARMCTRST